VKTPGVQQVQGGKTLFEMLSLAGGLDTNSGSVLRLTRRLEWGRIPLANATDDQTGQFSVAELSLKSIFDAQNPAENILVPPLRRHYSPASGHDLRNREVQKSGGFVVNDMTEVTVLQAPSMAGGLDKTAKPQRPRSCGVCKASRETEIAVNLKKILEGKAEDISMKPEDILFVPTSASKKAGIRAPRLPYKQVPESLFGVSHNAGVCRIVVASDDLPDPNLNKKDVSAKAIAQRVQRYNRSDRGEHSPY